MKILTSRSGSRLTDRDKGEPNQLSVSPLALWTSTQDKTLFFILRHHHLWPQSNLNVDTGMAVFGGSKEKNVDVVNALRDELWLRTLCTIVLRHTDSCAAHTRSPLCLESYHAIVPVTFPRLRVARRCDRCSFKADEP